jgi:hypothetical protein
VFKNYTSLATPSTLKSLKLKVFSILPKNTKKEEKSRKKHIIYVIQTNIPPILTPITRSNKVFSILPNNKEKNTHKPKNKIENKITQKRTKTSPKINATTLGYKIPDITSIPPQNKNKTKTMVKVIVKTTTTTKKTYHHLKSKPKNNKASIIQKNIKKNTKKNTKKYIKKPPTLLNTKSRILKYTFHDKKSILSCGDIENNPDPKFTLLLNHPQDHLEKHKTYFYKITTQIKNEYIHIFELFKLYLNHTYRKLKPTFKTILHK